MLVLCLYLGQIHANCLPNCKGAGEAKPSRHFVSRSSCRCTGRMAALSSSINDKPKPDVAHAKIQSLMQPSSKRKILLTAADAFPWIRTTCMKLDVSFEAAYRATWICWQLELGKFETGHFLQAVAAIIFLACKCSDQMRPPRDVLNCVHAAHLGDGHCIPLGSAYRTLKHSLISREALILRCIHFDPGMNEVTPHVYALDVLQRLQITGATAQRTIAALNDITADVVSLPSAAAGPAVCIVVLGALQLCSPPQAKQAGAEIGEESHSPGPSHGASSTSEHLAQWSAASVWAAACNSGISSPEIVKAMQVVAASLTKVWQTDSHAYTDGKQVYGVLCQLSHKAWHTSAESSRAVSSQ